MERSAGLVRLTCVLWVAAAAAVQCVSGRVCFEVGLECGACRVRAFVSVCFPRAFVFRAARLWPPFALQARVGTPIIGGHNVGTGRGMLWPSKRCFFFSAVSFRLDTTVDHT